MALSELKQTEQDIQTYGVQSAPDKLSGSPKENKAVFDRLFAGHRRQYDAQVRAKFGAEADSIGHVEVYEISEYGEEPSQAFMDMLER